MSRFILKFHFFECWDLEAAIGDSDTLILVAFTDPHYKIPFTIQRTERKVFDLRETEIKWNVTLKLYLLGDGGALGDELFGIEIPKEATAPQFLEMKHEGWGDSFSYKLWYEVVEESPSSAESGGSAGSFELTEPSSGQDATPVAQSAAGSGATATADGEEAVPAGPPRHAGCVIPRIRELCTELKAVYEENHPIAMRFRNEAHLAKEIYDLSRPAGGGTWYDGWYGGPGFENCFRDASGARQMAFMWSVKQNRARFHEEKYESIARQLDALLVDGGRADLADQHPPHEARAVMSLIADSRFFRTDAGNRMATGEMTHADFWEDVLKWDRLRQMTGWGLKLLEEIYTSWGAGVRVSTLERMNGFLFRRLVVNIDNTFIVRRTTLVVGVDIETVRTPHSVSLDNSSLSLALNVAAAATSLAKVRENPSVRNFISATGDGFGLVESIIKLRSQWQARAAGSPAARMAQDPGSFILGRMTNPAEVTKSWARIGKVAGRFTLAFGIAGESFDVGQNLFEEDYDEAIYHGMAIAGLVIGTAFPIAGLAIAIVSSIGVATADDDPLMKWAKKSWFGVNRRERSPYASLLSLAQLVRNLRYACTVEFVSSSLSIPDAEQNQINFGDFPGTIRIKVKTPGFVWDMLRRRQVRVLLWLSISFENEDATLSPTKYLTGIRGGHTNNTFDLGESAHSAHMEREGPGVWQVDVPIRLNELMRWKKDRSFVDGVLDPSFGLPLLPSFKLFAEFRYINLPLNRELRPEPTHRHQVRITSHRFRDTWLVRSL